MATQLEPDIHADEEAFRTEVQQFLAANFPAELKGKANALAGVDGRPTKRLRRPNGAKPWAGADGAPRHGRRNMAGAA